MPSGDSSPGVLLGLDFGSRKIGVARTDPTRTMTTPVEVLAARGWRNDIPAILVIASREEAAGIVVGLPVRDDGEITEQTLKTRRFVERLQAATSIPVFVHDERYSTWEAGQRRNSRRTTKRSKLAEDAEAAAIILESFLSSVRDG